MPTLIQHLGSIEINLSEELQNLPRGLPKGINPIRTYHYLPLQRKIQDKVKKIGYDTIKPIVFVTKPSVPWHTDSENSGGFKTSRYTTILVPLSVGMYGQRRLEIYDPRLPINDRYQQILLNDLNVYRFNQEALHALTGEEMHNKPFNKPLVFWAGLHK